MNDEGMRSDERGNAKMVVFGGAEVLTLELSYATML